MRLRTDNGTRINLGFRIDTETHTLKLTLSAYDRLRFLLRHVKNGSVKDRQRIAGYASWILFNLKWPSFFSRDLLMGDASWLTASMTDLAVLRPRPLLDAPFTLNVYSDATPHSLAGIIPELQLAWAQAFTASAEINHAETVAAIQTLTGRGHCEYLSPVPLFTFNTNYWVWPRPTTSAKALTTCVA